MKLKITRERAKVELEELLNATEKLLEDSDQFLNEFFFDSCYYYAEIYWNGKEFELYAENDGHVSIHIHGIETDKGKVVTGGYLTIAFYFEVPFEAHVSLTHEIAKYMFDWIVENCDVRGM